MFYFQSTAINVTTVVIIAVLLIILAFCRWKVVKHKKKPTSSSQSYLVPVDIQKLPLGTLRIVPVLESQFGFDYLDIEWSSGVKYWRREYGSVFNTQREAEKYIEARLAREARVIRDRERAEEHRKKHPPRIYPPEGRDVYINNLLERY